MFKLGVIVLSVVFLASQTHGLWNRGLREEIYASAKSAVENAIMENIETLEKKFEENSRIFNRTIKSEVRSAVKQISIDRVAEMKKIIAAEMTTKAAGKCKTERETADKELDKLTDGTFPLIEACATTASPKIMDDVKKSKDKAIEKINAEKKKIDDDGECHEHLKSRFGIYNAKYCCRRVEKTVDSILDNSLPTLELPKISERISPIVADCKTTNKVEYETYDKLIDAAYQPFHVCV